jgi:predicted esterase
VDCVQRSLSQTLTQQDNDHFNLKHQGILMTNEMEAKLKDLLGKGERVVFTGHSAGAAVAAYVYKELYRKGGSYRVGTGLSCLRPSCIPSDADSDTDAYPPFG